MTANANPELFNVSDGLVVRNVKRNVVGSRDQLSLQTTLEGGRHHDASDSPICVCLPRLCHMPFSLLPCIIIIIIMALCGATVST